MFVYNLVIAQARTLSRSVSTWDQECLATVGLVMGHTWELETGMNACVNVMKSFGIFAFKDEMFWLVSVVWGPCYVRLIVLICICYCCLYLNYWPHADHLEWSRGMTGLIITLCHIKYFLRLVVLNLTSVIFYKWYQELSPGIYVSECLNANNHLRTSSYL